MRNQSSAPSAMLPASQSNLWFRVKSNWTSPRHRPAHESKWINQQPLQDQTQQGCPTASTVSKGKKRDGSLGKAEILAHFTSWLRQNNTAVGSRTQSPGKWKEDSWAIRIWASLRTLSWAVLWHGLQQFTTNQVSLWLMIIHEMRGQYSTGLILAALLFWGSWKWLKCIP